MCKRNIIQLHIQVNQFVQQIINKTNLFSRHTMKKERNCTNKWHKDSHSLRYEGIVYVKSKQNTRKTPTASLSMLPARPVASLSFCQCSACGFTNRLNYCMVHHYNGLVGMFVANCGSRFICFSPELHEERQSFIQAYIFKRILFESR